MRRLRDHSFDLCNAAHGCSTLAFTFRSTSRKSVATGPPVGHRHLHVLQDPGGWRMIGGTLVTIHGLWSSAATWEQLNAIWYADEQLRGLRIHPFSYPSPKKPRLPFSATRVPDYDDVAQTLATWYKVRLAEERDIAIVTHSQGGLILQRFLIRMLHDGHGRELARIRSVVMLNCPNSGSEYLRSVRHFLGFRYHPQIGSLKIHDKQVADTQRTVLQRVVNAAGVDDYQCRIPFHVYAGNTDKIVNAASAQGAFPGCSVLAGDHFSVLDPAAPGNSTAETVKYHILTDWATALSQGQRSRFRVPISTSTWPAAEARRSGERLMVDGMDGQGVILDEDAAMQEQQAVRDLSAIQARQDEFARQLASLSEHTRQIEASTTARINVAAAMIMNEVREANRQLSADTRQLLDEQEKQFDATLTTERAERRRETDALRSELEHDRAAQVGVLDAARAAVADARVLHDAIGSCLPHERFAPGELARLTDRLVQAEASLAAGTGETALAQSRGAVPKPRRAASGGRTQGRGVARRPRRRRRRSQPLCPANHVQLDDHGHRRGAWRVRRARYRLLVRRRAIRYKRGRGPARGTGQRGG